MTEVELPGGIILEFPDEMSRDDIKAAIDKKFVGEAPTPEVPEGMFANPNTGQMTSRELLANTAETSPLRAVNVGLVQGAMLGSADEAAGLVGQLEGGEEMATFRREQARATEEAQRRDFPGTSLASEITGAVLSPATKAIGPVRTVKGAAATAGVVGAVEGFNRGEGGATERLKDAAIGGGTGALFGAGLSGVTKLGSKAFQKMFAKSVKRPTLGNLKATKSAAYRAVDEAGEKFSPDDMAGLHQRVVDRLKASDFDDIADPQTAATLRILERRKGEEVSLGRLDKLRQAMWKRYNRSDEPLILEAIDEIDDLISSRADASEKMAAARLANSRFKKAEMLEDAFKKARMQTDGTGSGGNILNKYRQAVTSIVTNPRKAKWFSKDEIALMEHFVSGSADENVLRRIGKLAPGGNGLMSALNLYAAAVDPTLLAATATASAAKGAADRSAMSGAEGLIDAVSTGVVRKSPLGPNLRDLSITSGVTLD